MFSIPISYKSFFFCLSRDHVMDFEDSLNGGIKSIDTVPITLFIYIPTLHFSVRDMTGVKKNTAAQHTTVPFNRAL